MKPRPRFSAFLAIPVFLALTGVAPLLAESIGIPGPDNSKIPANLLVIDQSSGVWSPLPATIQPSETGFIATITPPSGQTFNLTGTFEKTGDSVKCKIQWSGAQGLEKAFVMLVLVFPIASVSSAEVLSDGKDISVSRMLNGENVRNHLGEVSNFTFGPFNNRTLSFAFNAPLDLGGLVLGGKDFFHLRMKLSPSGTALVADKEVSWTMSWAVPPTQATP